MKNLPLPPGNSVLNRNNETKPVPQGFPALFQNETGSLVSVAQTHKKCLCRSVCFVVSVKKCNPREVKEKTP
jgi:hypothetical protein